jgi:tripartite ATP-independent transporter DctM subunit
MAQKPMRVKLTSPLAPPPFLISETAKWWADEVAKRSGGRIAWEFFWMGALTKAGEELEAVEIGLAQVGNVAAPYYAGKLPLNNWTYAVPFGPGDPKMILDASKQLYRDVPELGIITEQSIGILLIAGIGPGLLLALVFSIGVIIMSLRYPHIAPRAEVVAPWSEKIRALTGVWGILALVVGIIAGMYIGLFTPTEAGAAGALGVLILALLSRGLSWANFVAALNEAAQTTALVFFILIGAMIFARFLVLTGLPSQFSTAVTQAGISSLAIVVAFLLMYLLLEMFQDSISMMSITLPIVHPIIVDLSIDPVHFAMLVIITIEIGLLTPPVGLNVYTVRSVASQIPEVSDVSLDDIFWGILPFFVLSSIALTIMLFVPSISTFLPTTMFGK